MQQQKKTYKAPLHYEHIQKSMMELLKEAAVKCDTIILTNRTQEIILSILTQSQIYSCGLKKIVCSRNINPYMSYDQVVFVISLSEEELEQICQYSQQIERVYLVNLGISTKESRVLLKKISFKEKDSIIGYSEQNLDFIAYLHDTFVLGGYKETKKSNLKKGLDSNLAADRLTSYLLSYQCFSQFQFYIPKNSKELGKAVKQTMEEKIQILNKYNYKGLAKNQGLSGVKTKVIVLERTQDISPFILSLYYGPLAQELKIRNSCKFISVHSHIYNTLYNIDLLSASLELKTWVQQMADNKDKQMNTVDLKETKKILQKVYNSNLTKQQLKFHQTLLNEMNQFMKSNYGLVVLQQTLGNKINQNGQKMSGSSIIRQVYNWCLDNQDKYERYLGLVFLAFTVHDFWWYQKKQLLAGITEKEERAELESYIKSCKVHHLKQKQPTKDENGVEERQQCFRHSPAIINEFQKIWKQVNEKKVTSYDVIKVNEGEGSLSKKTQTVVYINGALGYNQLAMLRALKKNEMQFVCKQLISTRSWVQRLRNR